MFSWNSRNLFFSSMLIGTQLQQYLNEDSLEHLFIFGFKTCLTTTSHNNDVSIGMESSIELT